MQRIKIGTLLILLVLTVAAGLGRSTLAAPDPETPAGVITVDSLADELAFDGNCTLREAVLAAELNLPWDGCAAGGGALPADTITFSIDGTIELSAALGQLIVDEALVIQGSGRDQTIIDGGDKNRIFYVTGGLSFRLKSLTLQNGRDSDGVFGQRLGGAIRYEGALLALDDVRIRDSKSEYGGAISSDGLVTIVDSLFTRNSASRGGAVWVTGASLAVEDTLFTHNDVEGNSHGGALSIRDGNVTLTRVTIADNNADFSGAGGGGLAVEYYSSAYDVIITDSVITGNSAIGADLGGGGIYCKCNLQIYDSTISDNVADGANNGGGGIYCECNLQVHNSTISDNVADVTGGGGGGIYGKGNWLIVASTLSGNSATPGLGGGAGHNQGIFNLINSTVSGNNASLGGGLDLDHIAFIQFSTIANNHSSNGQASAIHTDDFSLYLTGSIISGNGGSAFACLHEEPPIGAGNLVQDISCASSDPSNQLGLDARLGPLLDNGGPTATHALLPDSPAIDYATCPDTLTVDQRGVARPQGSRCDKGAYEYDGSFSFKLYLPLIMKGSP